jgi:hypothetical protein
MYHLNNGNNKNNNLFLYHSISLIRRWAIKRGLRTRGKIQTAEPAADTTDPRKIVRSVTTHQDHENCHQAKYQPAKNVDVPAKYIPAGTQPINIRCTVVSGTVGFRSLMQSRILEHLLSFLQTY